MCINSIMSNTIFRISLVASAIGLKGLTLMIDHKNSNINNITNRNDNINNITNRNDNINNITNITNRNERNNNITNFVNHVLGPF